MMGTIDGTLEDFAMHCNMPWARQAVVGADASMAESRLFELLNMNLMDAALEAPFSVTAKSDIAYLLLRMVDDRMGMDFCEDVRLTHNGVMIKLGSVVDYESAKRIVERIIEWAGNNHERMLEEKATKVLGYREQAQWQEVAMGILQAVDERGIGRYDELEELLEEMGCPNPRGGDRLVESVANYIRASGRTSFGDKGELRKCHIPGVARHMKESGMQLSGSRGMGASSTSRMMSAAASSPRTERASSWGTERNYGAPGKAAEENPEDAANRLVQRALDSLDHEAKWRQKAVREGAIDALLHRLAKPGISKNREAVDAFRSALDRLSDWANPRQLRKMRQLGCTVSDALMRAAEEEAGMRKPGGERLMTKPVEGGRRRLVRKITSEKVEGRILWWVERPTTRLPDGREVFRVARRKGKPGGLTNGEKRRKFKAEREALAKARLRG